MSDGRVDRQGNCYMPPHLRYWWHKNRVTMDHFCSQNELLKNKDFQRNERKHIEIHNLSDILMCFKYIKPK